MVSRLEDSSTSKKRAVLSIDVGTSATKAALCFIDQRGRLGPVSRAAYETKSPENLHVTQCVNDWLRAAISASREALAGVGDDVDVVAIAVTGQMQDLIAVGPDSPSLLSIDAILYSDARAQQAAKALSVRCGTRVNATSILAKLMLLNPPSSSAAPNYSLLLGAADYIIHAFSASPKPTVTDATTVSTTGLTAAPHRAYNSTLLSQAGLSAFEPLLPSILAEPQVTGHLCSSVAAALGRSSLAGTPMVHAGGDAFSATAGAERDVLGGAYVYCGSSGWIGGTTSMANVETGTGLFGLGHAADAGAQLTVASVAAAGASVAFAGQRLLGGMDADAVARMAETVPIGAGGVMFVPYITGRRCPRPSDGARGALVGLEAGTSREKVARAVVEGVTFAVARAARTLPEGLVGEEVVRMVGGGVASTVFVRGIAALVARAGAVKGGEDSAVGVVGAARVATRVLDGGVEAWWRDGDVVVVGEEERSKWEKAFERWRNVVDALDNA